MKLYDKAKLHVLKMIEAEKKRLKKRLCVLWFIYGVVYVCGIMIIVKAMGG